MPKPRTARLLRLLPVPLLVFCLAGVAAAPETARRLRPPPLVVLSIDGLRPDYVREADRYGLRIPELRRLHREGASASGVVAVLPAVTYPGHATLVTGVAPARHGILANRTFDPLGRNQDGWYWYAEDLRAPTLWDAASRAGLRTGSVDWPVTVGARIDWNVPQVWRAETADDTKLVRAVATPGLLAEAELEAGPWPVGATASIEQDRRKAAFTVWLLRTKRPSLHLAYFASLDEAQHRSGPGSEDARETLEALDALVGEIRRTAESLGRPTLAVVSDHGFAHAARDLYLNDALRSEGLITLDARRRVSDWRAQAWPAGGCAAIFLKDPHDEATRGHVAKLLARLRGEEDGAIERVLTEEEAAALGGFPGAAFVVGLRAQPPLDQAGDSPTRAKPARGEHGYLPDNPEMDAAFLVSGPQIPAGLDLGRIDMRDVAPTLAARLGVRLPQAEGRDRLAPATVAGASIPLDKRLDAVGEALGQRR
jgi:predicted AlkP superfamily pyrophosphatase or phosphodiesterase